VPTLVGQYWRTGVSGMIRGMDAARRDSLELALAGVGCPVLLVRGAEDRIAPGDWLAELVSGGQRRGDDVRRVDLAAGGHMVPLTHGPLVAEAVSTFLESVAKA
jgi:pimeloyl-ACP methyl ester carboxylesterase